MIEQMNLFGEREPFDELIERIVQWYEQEKEFYEKYGWEFKKNFDTWLLDHFSTWMGGNADGILWGEWNFYQWSPSGLRLENSNKLIPRNDGKGTEWYYIFFPKKKILNAFGIKDDRNDALKEGSE